eukprot:jgi/Undpi1/8636/HiC_scaffold_25.g11101.m1
MSCNTTPPLSLPGRGWGDSGSSGCVGHFGPSYSNSLYGSQGVDSSISGGSRGSISSGGRSAYGGGGEGADGLMRFHLDDGFSSAEEETWGSEGEIEETTAAGRYAVVGNGKRRVSDGGVVAGPRSKGVATTTPPPTSSARSTLTESFGTGCGGGSGCGGVSGCVGGGGGGECGVGSECGGGGGAGAKLDGDGEARESLLAPFCGNGCGRAGIATGLGRSGGASLGLGGRRAARKAAMGAGRAKRAVASGGDIANRLEENGSRRGAEAAARRGRRCGSGGGRGGGEGRPTCKRPLRLSRPLFIEIENKASEPPLRVAAAAAGAGASAWRQKGAVVAGQRREQQTNPARPRSEKRRDDGELEDSDGEAESWYQALTNTGTVKFSEVRQASPSSLSAAV